MQFFFLSDYFPLMVERNPQLEDVVQSTFFEVGFLPSLKLLIEEIESHEENDIELRIFLIEQIAYAFKILPEDKQQKFAEGSKVLLFESLFQIF